jgi:hypothetical protein
MFHKYSYLLVYFEVQLVYQAETCFIVIAITVYCGDAIIQQFLVYCAQDDHWSNNIIEIIQKMGDWVRIWQVLGLDPTLIMVYQENMLTVSVMWLCGTYLGIVMIRISLLRTNI